MMKISFFCLLAILSTFCAKAQDEKTPSEISKKRDKQTIRRFGSLNDVAVLDEGYNESDGGLFAVKDFLVKGKVNFIRLSYGTRVANPNFRDWMRKPKYYLQNTEIGYREIFLTNQDPSAAAVILTGSSTTRQSLNNRKFLGPMLTSSKQTLRDVMGDNIEVATTISGLKRISESKIKRLVKTYNQ